MMSPKPSVYFDITGADGVALKDFYSDIFEWHLDPFEGVENYFMASAEETTVGGADTARAAQTCQTRDHIRPVP